MAETLQRFQRNRGFYRERSALKPPEFADMAEGAQSDRWLYAEEPCPPVCPREASTTDDGHAATTADQSHSLARGARS